MDALHTLRINPDFAPRHRLGQARHQGRVYLESQRFTTGGGKGIGAQDRLDQCMVKPQQPVIVDRGDVPQASAQSLRRLGGGGLAIAGKAGIVAGDRKSTRLNSSHYCASRMPSYALTKKNKT